MFDLGPPEPWELDYPHRASLWTSRHDLLAAYLGRAPLPEGVTRAEALARAQLGAALYIERLARAVFRGEQFTGILEEKRRRVVDSSDNARVICAIWNAGPRTPQVQAFVDRAVGCWRQCVERGVEVFEYDRPGYDEVTKFFVPILAFASRKTVTPVVLEWDPEYHGPPPAPPRS